jgi:hypothetical protein
MPLEAHRRARTVLAGVRADRSPVITLTRELIVVVVVANIARSNHRNENKRKNTARVRVDPASRARRRRIPTRRDVPTLPVCRVTKDS